MAGAGAAIVLAGGLAWLGYSNWALLPYALAIVLTIPGPAQRAWESVQRRVLDIHVLMVIAVGGALILGDWLEAATVIWLFAVSEWLEARTIARARRAIRDLMTMAPTEALVRRGGGVVTVPVESLVIGDVVLVRPGERVPVDACVVSGESAINQAPVTGESFPVE